MLSPTEITSTGTQTETIYSCNLHSFHCDYDENQNDYQKGVSATVFDAHSSSSFSCGTQL